MTDLSFYRDKKILVTGNTGFKGSWVTSLLLKLGAKVMGYALEPPTEPSMFELCGLGQEMETVIGDIRDLDKLQSVMKQMQPEFVLHMAAQPIVRESYRNPVYTYSVNVMGTVNVLECVRNNDCVKSFLNVTTDKVYLNREWQWGYRENEELNGYDPYSNSKSCSELVTGCYRNSFFGKGSGRATAISTARAGNVIGGGDFAKDRILPDCVRSVQAGKKIVLRNPDSVRPYQHVLEPTIAYLLLLQHQYHNIQAAGSYNVGPDETDCISTGEIADAFCREWDLRTGRSVEWTCNGEKGPHEANFLKLDCTKLKNTIGWRPSWDIGTALSRTVEWYAAYLSGEEVRVCTERQIDEFLRGFKAAGNQG